MHVDSAADKARRNLAAWSLLAGLAILAALAAPYFAGLVYTADDLGAFHLPLRAFFAKQLANGEPFDWMPNLFSGFYLTGEGQAGLYHPLHQALYRFLPLRAALCLECLLSYPWMLAGTWLWLRRRLQSTEAAMFGAVIFAFSSFNLLHFVHPNAVAIVAHIPWLLWAIDVVLTDSRRNYVAGATVAIALLTASQILLGYPQYVWFSLLAEVSYAAYLLASPGCAAKVGCERHASCDGCIGCTAPTWPRVVIAKEIGLLIGSVQWLPTLDAWLHSARASTRGGDFAAWGSLHPLNLLQFVAPYLFADRVVGDSTHEFGLYVGVVPLLLVIWVASRRRELGVFAPLVLAAAAFGALALTLALGRFGILYGLLSWLPIVGSFRMPCRYLVLFQLAVALVASVGFAMLVRESWRAKQQRKPNSRYRERHPWKTMWRSFEPLWCAVGVSLFIAGVGLACRNDQYVASTGAILAGPVLFMAGAVLVAMAARGYPAALVGLVLLGALDIGWYGLSYSVYQEVTHIASGNIRHKLRSSEAKRTPAFALPATRNAPPPTVAVLSDYVADAGTPPERPDGRVLGSLLRFDQPGLRTGDLMIAQGWRRADGYAGIEPRRQLDYSLPATLRLAGVRWVRRDGVTCRIPGLETYDSDWLESPNPLPRVRLVTETKVDANPREGVAKTSVETTALTDKPIELPRSKPGLAVLTSDRPGRLDVAVDCPERQLLVVSESHHAGWRAAVDGRPVEVVRVNGDFMGCVAPKGKHQITFKFQPESLRQGRFYSWLGLGMAAIAFVGFGYPFRLQTSKENPS